MKWEPPLQCSAFSRSGLNHYSRTMRSNFIDNYWCFPNNWLVFPNPSPKTQRWSGSASVWFGVRFWHGQFHSSCRALCLIRKEILWLMYVCSKRLWWRYSQWRERFVFEALSKLWRWAASSVCHRTRIESVHSSLAWTVLWMWFFLFHSRTLNNEIRRMRNQWQSARGSLK